VGLLDLPEAAGHARHAAPPSDDSQQPASPTHAAAIVAHCFTCGKESIAAARIARALTDRGFQVLRFDVTGLGESEGEFGAATFSMDVADLAAAAAYLRSNHQAPQLLIGHSLGGAAVLAAAAHIPECRAVVTIAAPSDPGHLADLLRVDADDVAADGVVDVQIGGRPFTLHKAFLEDIAQQPQRERIAALGRALLVLHSPEDRTVSIDNATEIFRWARHPKSFVALDGANHLLTDPDDARWVAELVATWAGRYLAGA
jgi:putative redox protein